jgi:hypothetical protein
MENRACENAKKYGHVRGLLEGMLEHVKERPPITGEKYLMIPKRVVKNVQKALEEMEG